VRNILEHAAAYRWRVQAIGLLGLWLDDRREYRLQVWNPEGALGEPPVHDTSKVFAGELVNTRYVEDPRGREYVRERYSPTHEDDRIVDTVLLAGTPETLRAGDRYRQRAEELHDSRQVQGAVTVVRFEGAVDHCAELTTCRRPGTPWVSGRARPATPAEVERITGAALALFAASEPR
jgi:hypothetical protein